MVYNIKQFIKIRWFHLVCLMCAGTGVSHVVAQPISVAIGTKTDTPASGTKSVHENDSLTYYAYLMNAAPEVVKSHWIQAVAVRQGEFEQDTASTEKRYRLALAQFGLLSTTMRDGDEELFDQYADLAEQHLDNLIKADKTWGEPKALLSGLLGMRMRFSPWKGMYMGPRSSSLVKSARQENPTSPLVNKFYATSKYFTPEMWGGDLPEAILAYEKATGGYEETGTSKNNWFYLDAVAFLGQAYVKNGEVKKAIACYQHVLEREPAFAWVKYELLPKALKMNNP